jgi:hypothetical protein
MEQSGNYEELHHFVFIPFCLNIRFKSQNFLYVQTTSIKNNI